MCTPFSLLAGLVKWFGRSIESFVPTVRARLKAKTWYLWFLFCAFDRRKRCVQIRSRNQGFDGSCTTRLYSLWLCC